MGCRVSRHRSRLQGLLPTGGFGFRVWGILVWGLPIGSYPTPFLRYLLFYRGDPTRPRCFFLLWPLFARAPRHWFLEFFLLSAPGVQSVFFCCAPLGAATFRRGQSKKKTPPRVFFFLLRPRGKAGEGEAPCRHGARAKKNTTQGVVFFAAAPAKGKGRRSPVGSRHGARAKKKNTTQGFFFCSSPGERQGKEKPRWAPARWCFFFALAPCRRPTGLLLPLPFPGGRSRTKNTWVVFFFCSGPVPAPNGASPSLAFRRGRSKKKNSLGGVFFFCSGPVPARGFSFPCLSPGPEQKKKTPWVVFFFLLRPRADAHSLTAGLGGDASPSPGWRLFFCCGAGPDRGGVFFFAVAPPGRSLTPCGLGRFRQGPGGVFFFGCGPAGSF